MNRLKIEKKKMVLNLLVEGSSIRGTQRITGVNRRTIIRIIREAGEHCQYYMSQQFRNLECQNIECDELWTYVGKKQKRIKSTDNKNEVGDQYIFLAIDRDTKLIPLFSVGKRTAYTAYWFMWELRRRIKGTFQLTTDKFRGYQDAVSWTFGTVLDYAVLEKHYYGERRGIREGYSPTKLIGIVKSIIHGCPNPAMVCTSIVERHNLTMRTMVKRFTRLSIAFSKKLDCLIGMVAIYLWYYNFKRIHKSLRVTPAMEAGIVSNILDWDVVLS